MAHQWKFFPTILLLILSESFISLECWTIQLPDVTYEDIESLNATCKGSDSCELPRTKDTLEQYNCNCGSSCSLLGTCCVDSKHRQKYPKPIENVYCDQYYDEKETKYYFFPMIYSCNPDLENDKSTEKLCHSYTNDDPFLKIPVTDPVTGISYKNYYCHACNENYGEEEPIPWNLELKSFSEKVESSSIPNLHFDTTRYRWVMDYGEENETDVNSFLAALPEELKTVVPFCFNFIITSECASDWTDNNIREKCLAYMALTRIQKTDLSSGYKKYYRNPHCAICNYESIENIVCSAKDENKIYGHGSYGIFDFFVGLFYLNGKINQCEDNMVYDQFAKKCRKIFRAKRRLL